MALRWPTRRGRAADPARKEKHRAVTVSAQQTTGMRTLDYTAFGEGVGKQAPRVLLVQSGLSVYHRIWWAHT